MQNQDNGSQHQLPPPKYNKKLLIALIVIATILVLTWAIATVFEIVLAKALAVVIIVLFFVAIALFMIGLI